MKRHEIDGVSVCINWNDRLIFGWSYSVKNDDEILVPMHSGRNAILRVKNLRRMNDPKDQYFADLEDVGYVEDLKVNKQDNWDKFCEDEFNRIMPPRKKKTLKEKLHSMISNLKDFLNAKIFSKISRKA